MKPSPPVQVTRRGMMAAGLVIGVGFALVLIAGVFLALKLGVLVDDNRHAIDRIHRIEAPSDADILAGTVRALRAIRSCARSPACRKRNPGVASVARSIPRGELPRARRAARRRRSTSSSSGGGSSGGATTGGNGTTTGPAPSPGPRAPSQTGSRPQPTVRPPAASPSPANPPASPPQAAPKPQPAPAPTPQPPAPVPTVTAPPTPTVPPVTPVVPPVTVPVPIQVCVPPLIVVNCRRPNGRLVGPTGETADPDTNSGRGSLDDLLCERLKNCPPSDG